MKLLRPTVIVEQGTSAANVGNPYRWRRAVGPLAEGEGFETPYGSAQRFSRPPP